MNTVTKNPIYAAAREILGENFISAEEIATARGLSYTEDQLIELRKSLPDQATLIELRDSGMVLMAGPPIAMSIIDVRAADVDFFRSKGPDYTDQDWYDDVREKFATTDKVEALCWIALRKEPVEDSLSKDWTEQQALVKESMVIPNAAEAVWALTTYKAVRDIYLLEDLYVRTSSVDLVGNHVDVGDFGYNGLCIHVYRDDGRRSYLGVSASRKF